MKKLWKSARHNHKYLWVPVEPEVDLGFQGHSNMNIINGFIDLENMNSEEISKIYKTESSVPPKPEVDLDFRGHKNMEAQ